MARGKGGGSTYYDATKSKWVAELKWVDPATGKLLKAKRYANSRREAEKLLAELVDQKSKGLLAEPSKQSTREFALEYLKRLEREACDQTLSASPKKNSCALCPPSKTLLPMIP